MRACVDAMIPRGGPSALLREDLHCVFKRDPAARTRTRISLARWSSSLMPRCV